MAGEPLQPAEFRVLHAVLDVLGIGLQPTLAHLVTEQPSDEAFEEWLTAQRGGPPDSDLVARARRIATGAPPTTAESAWHAELARAPAVLSESDLASWHADGYVVVRAAAPEPARAALENAVWARLGADPSSPSSWYGASLEQGIMVAMHHAPGIAAIHASLRVQKAFQQLLGTADLVMSADRCGFNAPLREGDSFRASPLHLDLDDFTTPVGLGVQGVLYLTDTAADQGAFRCVPGFHHRIDSWLEDLGRVPRPEDLDGLEPRAIAASAGDLIIWHQGLPHGSSPNRSTRPRLVHYLTMYPVLDLNPPPGWRAG